MREKGYLKDFNHGVFILRKIWCRNIQYEYSNSNKHSTTLVFSKRFFCSLNIETLVGWSATAEDHIGFHFSIL